MEKMLIYIGNHSNVQLPCCLTALINTSERMDFSSLVDQSVNDIVISPFREGFIFAKTSDY